MFDSFPILWPTSRRKAKELQRAGCPRTVPWGLVAPHEPQALKNHDQSLQRLAERGGLSPAELLAVLSGVSWPNRPARTDLEAVPHLLKAIQLIKNR